MTSAVTISAVLRVLARVLLGAALAFAGVSHLWWARAEFQAQVPPWLPLDADLVVVASGVVEISLGIALVVVPRRFRSQLGWVVAAFFLIIFPGNVAQWLEQRDAFGLDSDTSRFVRLFFQPVLVVWALWATAAWSWWRSHRNP